MDIVVSITKTLTSCFTRVIKQTKMKENLSIRMSNILIQNKNRWKVLITRIKRFMTLRNI